MTRTPPPYAALTVVALTTAVFVYFSCAGGANKEEGSAKTKSQGFETFGAEVDPEVGGPLPVAEAQLEAFYRGQCGDPSEGVESCGDAKTPETIGNGP